MKAPNIAELNTIQKLEVEIALLGIIIIIGSIVFTLAEDINYFNALYFSIITLAGIGYGDIVPYTVTGKIVSMVYALVGLPLFIAIGYVISSLLLTPIKKTRTRRLKAQIIKDQENMTL